MDNIEQHDAFQHMCDLMHDTVRMGDVFDCAVGDVYESRGGTYDTDAPYGVMDKPLYDRAWRDVLHTVVNAVCTRWQRHTNGG